MFRSSPNSITLLLSKDFNFTKFDNTLGREILISTNIITVMVFN